METESPAVECLTLDVKQTAGLIGVSESTFWKMHSQGLVPLPLRFGRVRRWRREEIAAWIKAGCPHRDQWQYR